MSRDSSKTRETLSEQETLELSGVLDDRFSVFVSTLPGAAVPEHRALDDPFWHLSLLASSDGNQAELDGFLRLMQAHSEQSRDPSSMIDAENVPEQAALERYLAFARERVSGHPPRWWSTSPFTFDVAAIERFFQRQFQQIADELGLRPTLPEELILPDIAVELFEPFSKRWMECIILDKILDIRRLEKASSTPAGWDSAWHQLMLTMAFGHLGRMVEQYRWRFSYGRDALRGRSNLAAAASGGQARGRERQAQNLPVLAEMKRRIDGGEGVSNAARLTFKKGLGPSAEANRKLWIRHRGR